MNALQMTIHGVAVPKQSFRYGANGHSHAAPRAKAWQDLIRCYAKDTIPAGWNVDGQYKVILFFYLPDNRRKDLDNLSKAVLDALNGAAWVDDTQVSELHLWKAIDRGNPRVEIRIYAHSMPDISCAGRCAR